MEWLLVKKFSSPKHEDLQVLMTELAEHSFLKTQSSKYLTFEKRVYSVGNYKKKSWEGFFQLYNIYIHYGELAKNIL